MKMHIKEFANLTGVSVRTLHYYDEIGLLEPPFVDEQNGYRCYDEKSLERMQEILFYRELDFSLKSITEILSSLNYDKNQALSKQRKLLILKRKRLDRLISAIDNSMKGVNIMNINAFDNTEYEKARKKYMSEAKENWGETSAYKEHSEKTKDYSNEKWKEIYKGLDDIFDEFSKCFAEKYEPSSSEVQAAVKKLQDYISENFYKCTKEILLGLGEMYVNDERFKQNIDSHGAGSAEFINKAIGFYCK